jgi:hypothetical protein
MIAPSSKGHDFLNLYSAGSLALDGKFATLHDTAVQLEREQRFVPSTQKLIPPLAFGFALAGKPYAIVASASLLIFFLLLAYEKYYSSSK